MHFRSNYQDVINKLIFKLLIFAYTIMLAKYHFQIRNEFNSVLEIY